jgi:thiamine-phosphate diphosphorylase
MPEYAELQTMNNPISHQHTFPDCGPEPLGLYPLVDSAIWVEKLLTWGVTTIQLRIKNKPDSVRSEEIATAVAIAKRHGGRLFINDDWQSAIHYDAYGIHLGQEDLNTVNMQLIQQAGLRLGISTANEHELVRALAYNPSYIAFGHIFHTNSKIMSHPPQGLSRLKQWRNQVNGLLVAIGGINLSNLAEVLACGIDGVAMISAITQATDPEWVTQEMLRLVKQVCV